MKLLTYTINLFSECQSHIIGSFQRYFNFHCLSAFRIVVPIICSIFTYCLNPLEQDPCPEPNGPLICMCTVLMQALILLGHLFLPTHTLLWEFLHGIDVLWIWGVKSRQSLVTTGLADCSLLIICFSFLLFVLWKNVYL